MGWKMIAKLLEVLDNAGHSNLCDTLDFFCDYVCEECPFHNAENYQTLRKELKQKKVEKKEEKDDT